MRTIKLVVIFIVIITTFSCNTGTTPSTAGVNATTDSMKYFNEQIYKGFETGDFSVFDRVTSPDVTDHSMGDKEVVGKDKVKASLQDMMSQMKDAKFDIITQGADSNYTTTLVRMTGTSTSAKSGFPAGAPIDMMSVDVLKWKDGKVTDHWGYMDPKDVMKMMAAMPGAANTSDSSMHKK